MSHARTVVGLWAAVAVAAAGVCAAIVIGAVPQAIDGAERAVLPSQAVRGGSAGLPASDRSS